MDISQYELLSGAEHIGTRSRDNQTYVFAKDTELGMVVETYQQLDYERQKRLLGYMDALKMSNQKIVILYHMIRKNEKIRTREDEDYIFK